MQACSTLSANSSSIHLCSTLIDEDEQDEESIGRHRRRGEAQSIENVWAWLRQMQTGSSDVEIMRPVKMIRATKARSQHEAQGLADHGDAVRRTLDAISDGGAAFSDRSSCSGATATRPSNNDTVPPRPVTIPQHIDPDAEELDCTNMRTPEIQTEALVMINDYVDEINAGVLRSQRPQTAQTTHEQKYERMILRTMSSLRKTHPPRPETSPAKVFSPPTSAEPVPDPVKPKATAGRCQEASPTEAFLPPNSATPIADPLKSRGTAGGSPFRPCHAVRRVGHFVEQREVTANGPMHGKGLDPRGWQHLGGYGFVLEQAGLDK
ncbi:MAG: hypothetical protein Q9170_000842 [Blastenia crenularia]